MKTKTKENIVILTIALAIAFVQILPSFIGLLHKVPGKVFTGNTFYFDAYDVNVYASVINWSQHNNFRLENAYTTEQVKNNVNFYPLYTTSGILFKNTNPYLVYHLLIVLCTIFFVLLINKATSNFIDQFKHRALFLVLLCFSGGLGWLFYRKIYSPDIYTTPFTIFSNLQKPHSAIAIGSYITSYLYFYLFLKKPNKTYFLTSLVFFLIFMIFYPFLMLSYFITIIIFTIYVFLEKKGINIVKNIICFILFSLPVGIAYSLYLSDSDQFRGLISQNLHPPKSTSLFLGYGILLITLVYQIFNKKRKEVVTYLIIWFFVGITLAYTPIGFGRLYFNSLFFPLVLIVFLSYKDIVTKIKSGNLRNAIVITFVLSSTLTCVLMIAISIFSVTNTNKWNYLKQTELDILNYLNNNAEQKDVVIANYPLSNFIPVYTMTKVYYGHGIQTIDANNKLKGQNSFLSGELNKSAAKDFVANATIKYVITPSQNMDNIALYKSNDLDIILLYKNDDLALLELILVN